MKFAPPPRFLLLPASLAAFAAFFGLIPFHAEDDPDEAFTYDRTESVLHLSLEAPGGTSLSPADPPAGIELLLQRHSWQIWRQPSTGSEEYRHPTVLPESGASVSLSLSPSMGSLADTTLLTDGEGRAGTTFSPEGATGPVMIEAVSGESTASLAFDIVSTPGTEETWSYSHTEATLVAEITSELSTQEVPAGETRTLSLSVRYETWDVLSSNFGNSRTDNHTSAPAEGAAVGWSNESGDGSVSGYGTTDAAGLCQGAFTMGSGEATVRAEISYATGHATFATLHFSPPPPPLDPGSTWVFLRSETVPSIVNLSADGPTELATGETRQIHGQVQGEIWDVWSDGTIEDRRFNYTTPLPGATLLAEIAGGDGSVPSPSLTTDGSGWFSTGFTMGTGPARLDLRFEGEPSPAASVDFTLAPGGGGPGGGDWTYLYSDGGYAIENLVIDGPTYDLPPGEVRTIGGTLIWVGWEVWGDSTGATETRAGGVSLVAWAPLTFAITHGDGALSATAVTTGSQGEFSTTFTMGALDSAVSLDGPDGTDTTIGFTAPVPPAVWTKIRDESRIAVALSAGDGTAPAPGQSVALRAAVTATTWEVWESDAAEVELRNEQTGPAIGATVDFSRPAGPGTLGATQAVTDANGIATVLFLVGESPSTLRADAVFATANASAEMLLSPELWVKETSHASLELSLAVIGDPATGLGATVRHRTWEVWRKPSNGDTETRHEAFAPAENAELRFAVLEGGPADFGTSPAYTGVTGTGHTTYRSGAPLTVSVTAAFAGLNTSAILAVPQGWGVVGTEGGGTQTGGTGTTGGTGGTNPGGTGGTNGGGTNGDPDADPDTAPPPVTFTLQGHGLELSPGEGMPDDEEEVFHPFTTGYEYTEAYTEETKVELEELTWEVYAESMAPDPEDATQLVTTCYHLRREIVITHEEQEYLGGPGKPFEAVHVGGDELPAPRSEIEDGYRVKERNGSGDPFTGTPTITPEIWSPAKRGGADPAKTHYTSTWSDRTSGTDEEPAIYPAGVFRNHVWLRAEAPVPAETKRTFFVVVKRIVNDPGTGTTTETAEAKGTVTFTIPENETVSSGAEVEGASAVTEVVPGGIVELTAPDPAQREMTMVSLLPIELSMDIDNDGEIGSEDVGLAQKAFEQGASEKDVEKGTEYLFYNDNLSNGTSELWDQDDPDAPAGTSEDDDAQEILIKPGITEGEVWLDHPAINGLSFYESRECNESERINLSPGNRFTISSQNPFPDEIFVRAEGSMNFPPDNPQVEGNLILKIKIGTQEVEAAKIKLTIVRAFGAKKYFQAARDYILENNSRLFVDDREFPIGSPTSTIRICSMREEATTMVPFESYHDDAYKNYLALGPSPGVTFEPDRFTTYGLGIDGAIHADTEMTVVINGNQCDFTDPSLPDPRTEWGRIQRLADLTALSLLGEAHLTDKCHGRLIINGVLNPSFSDHDDPSTLLPGTSFRGSYLAGDDPITGTSNPGGKYIMQSGTGSFEMGAGHVPMTAANAIGGLSGNYSSSDRENYPNSFVGLAPMNEHGAGGNGVVFVAMGKGASGAGKVQEFYEAAKKSGIPEIPGATPSGGLAVIKLAMLDSGDTSCALAHKDPSGNFKMVYKGNKHSGFPYYTNTFLRFKAEKPR